MSPAQFDASIRAVIPDLDGTPSDGFVGTLENSSRFGGAANTVDMSEPHVDDLLDTMQDLAQQVRPKLASWVNCDPTAAECDNAVVEALLTRFARRPPQPDEQQRYVDFLRAQRDAFDAEAALALVTQAVLMSPASLYRTEVGDGGGAMTDYELASAISFALTDSPPDEGLMQAAANGELSTPAGRRQQATRLLGTPGNASGLLRFMNEYIRSDRVFLTPLDPELFPDYDRELQQLLYDEYVAFVDHVLWNDTGTFANLMTAPYTFANQALAEHYGIEAQTGDDFDLVTADGRMGLLTQGVYLVQLANDKGTGTSIVRRGITLREKFLCLPPISPPPDVNDDLPDELEGPSTQRQRLAVHSVGACAGCHAQIDPFGYPFELFDPLGRPRTTEQGIEIDPNAELPIYSETVAVDSVAELAVAISDRPKAQDCFVGYILLFLDGIERAAACLPDSGPLSVRDMLTEVVAAPRFAERPVQ